MPPREPSRPVELRLPFSGRWRVEMSPARRVPSHGTHRYGTTYAIDFVAVDARGRSGPVDWRTLVATEPPQRYVGFGRPVLAPCEGTVVDVLDGVPDHGGRRSALTLVPYALGQARRVRQGVDGIAGNRVTIAYGGVFVTLVHLRQDSLEVAVGDVVTQGRPLAQCGSSGNVTEPCVHVQVNDGADVSTARGLPLAFRDFREWPRSRGGRTGRGATSYDATPYEVRALGVPAERSVVEPVQHPA